MEVSTKRQGNQMETTIVRPEVELTLADRCDASAIGACAAAVAVWLHEGNNPILFCNHHWHASKDAVLALSPFHIQEGGE